MTYSSYQSKIQVNTKTYDLINLHAKLSGQLSVSVSDPVHCPATGQVLVRERVPVVLQGTEQELHAPYALH